MAIRLPSFFSEATAGFNFFPIAVTSHLIRGLLTEDTGGLDQQNDDQKDKGKGIGEFRPTKALDDVFTNTNDECANHCAGHRADAAEHRRHEGFQAGHGAGGGHDGVVVGKVQQGTHRRQEATDGEGHADDLIDLDAHKLTGLKIPGHRPHGHTDLGLFDHGHQDDHQDHRQDGRDQRNHGGGSRADLDLLGQERDGGIDLRQAAGEIQGAVLQQIGHPDGRDHNRRLTERTEETWQ